jgi:hypothetical protein
LHVAALPQLQIEELQSTGNILIWGPEWEPDKILIVFPMDSMRVDAMPSIRGYSQNHRSTTLCACSWITFARLANNGGSLEGLIHW